MENDACLQCLTLGLVPRRGCADTAPTRFKVLAAVQCTTLVSRGNLPRVFAKPSSQTSVRRQAFLSWRACRSGRVFRLWGSAASFRRFLTARRRLLDGVRVFQSSVLLFSPLRQAQPQAQARAYCS